LRRITTGLSIALALLASAFGAASSALADDEARLWPRELVVEHYDLYLAKADVIQEFPEFTALDVLGTLRQAQSMIDQLPDEPWVTPAMNEQLAALKSRFEDVRGRIDFPGVTRDLLRELRGLIAETRAVLLTGYAGTEDSVWLQRPALRQLFRLRARADAFTADEVQWNDLAPAYAMAERLMRAAATQGWIGESRRSGHDQDLALVGETIGRLLSQQLQPTDLQALKDVLVRFEARLADAGIAQPEWARAEIFWSLVDIGNEMSGTFEQMIVRRGVLMPVFTQTIAVALAMREQEWSDAADRDKIDFQVENLRTEAAGMEPMEITQRHILVVSFAVQGFAAMALDQQ
jgi:hypothetical protein